MDWWDTALRVARHTRLISAAGASEGPQPDRLTCTFPFYYTRVATANGVPRESLAWQLLFVRCGNATTTTTVCDPSDRASEHRSRSTLWSWSCCRSHMQFCRQFAVRPRRMARGVWESACAGGGVVVLSGGEKGSARGLPTRAREGREIRLLDSPLECFWEILIIAPDRLPACEGQRSSPSGPQYGRS